MQENQPTAPVPATPAATTPTPPVAMPPATAPSTSTPPATPNPPAIPEEPKKSNTGIMIAAAVLALLVLSAAGYFVYKSYFATSPSSDLYTPVPTAYVVPSPEAVETSTPSGSPMESTSPSPTATSTATPSATP